MNKLYLVGVGPGDPELITVKAKRVIKNSDTIFYIENGDSNLAFSIIKDYLSERQEKIPLKLPMTSDREVKEESYKIMSHTIKDYLKHSDCALITLGDPAVYSTAFYILESFKNQVEIIPGISSFSALSADLKIPLAIGKESFAVINSSLPDEQILNELKNNDTVVILRIIKRRIKFLKELIQKLKLEKCVIIYSDIGFDSSRISRNIEDLNSSLPYMTTILIKKNL